MRGYLADQQYNVCGRERSVVQRVFFAAPFTETPDDLYAGTLTEGWNRKDRELSSGRTPDYPLIRPSAVSRQLLEAVE